ncbi:MAG: hypothetical protein GC154_20530 [bacterium]|nr:hypothetical protein [bacterium]
MFRIKSLFEIDFFSILLMLGLIGLGLASITGATFADSSPKWINHLESIVIAIPVFIFVMLVDYRWMIKWAPLIYIAGIAGLLLCFVPGLAPEVKGAHSWVRLAGRQIQPSEFAKLTTILMLARWLGMRPGQWNRLTDVLQPLAIGVIPAVLILKQPDLGTATVFGPVTLVMMFVAGMPVTHLLLILSPALCLLGAIHTIEALLLWISCMFGLILLVVWRRVNWTVWLPFLALAFIAFFGIYQYGEKIWEKAPNHAKERINVYLDPEYDLRGVGYNIYQAKIALGSGGFHGKGLGKGAQAQYEFLPEFEHDFAFPNLGEQLGFIGGAVMLGLFLLLILRGVDTAIGSVNMEGSLIATGVVALFFTHIFINVGMVTGLLPVTGLPLTFISFGGTFMLTSMSGVALLVAVRMQSRQVQDPEARFTGRPQMALPSANQPQEDF